MNNRSIISPGEAMQILKHDLRKAALKKRASELANATEDRRKEILAEIDRELQAEIRLWLRAHPHVLY